jgi:hypothetical protein
MEDSVRGSDDILQASSRRDAWPAKGTKQQAIPERWFLYVEKRREQNCVEGREAGRLIRKGEMDDVTNSPVSA